jgi:cytochrome c peroxidase
MASLLLALIYLTAAAVAAAQSPNIPTRAGQEPITPIPAAAVADPRRLALGEKLFVDPRLSGNNTRSCSTCHDIRTNGATSNRLDRTPEGAPLPLNTLTIFNAALSFA